MKILEFTRLPRLEDNDDFSEKLKEGDRFLYGTKMKFQLETKKDGDEVAYFRVIKIKNKAVEYITEFATLEKDR